MSQDGSRLTDEDLRVLELIDGFRKRGVLTAKITAGTAYLEVALSPEIAPENQLTEQQRQLLLNNPETPESMKARLREEYERDLYASS